MKLKWAPRSAEKSGETRIVFVAGKQSLLSGEPDLAAKLAAQIKKTAFDGETAQTRLVSLPAANGGSTIILAGIGASKSIRPEFLERAAAAAIRCGSEAGEDRFLTVVPPDLNEITAPAFIRSVARGAAWGTYRFTAYKKQPEKNEPSLTFTGPPGNTAACRRVLHQAELEAAALCTVADLANLPGNAATPGHIADWSRKMARENGLGFSSIGKEELKKKKCNALLAVAAGSAQDAKIITLKYRGTNPNARPVVLIGKTITFDSGGISLKPGKGMEWMRYDKCGGMAVLAVMQAVAQLKPETPVIGMLAVAENMPGATATRPGDIVRAHNGLTIEILNTDAEGRLVLADAISLAKQHRPAAIVDIATLTGAVIVALGHAGSAVLGNDPELTRALVRAGEAGGERLWELPVWPEHLNDIKGTFADLQNIGKSGSAGTIIGGAFLSRFVPEGIPWAHLDIAGTAWQDQNKPWMDPGATLFGARTLIEWICNLKSSRDGIGTERI